MSAVEWADRDHVAHIARAAVPASPLLYSVRYAVADAILASDWLAEHDRKIKAEALREAAQEAAHLGTVSGSQVHVGDRAAAMLHRLADDIEADHE